MKHGLLAGHKALADHLRQRDVEQAHALGGAGLENRTNLKALRLADEIRHRAGAQEDLERRPAPLAVGAPDEALRQALSQQGVTII